jgi:hypothetical protein
MSHKYDRSTTDINNIYSIFLFVQVEESGPGFSTASIHCIKRTTSVAQGELVDQVVWWGVEDDSEPIGGFSFL